MAVNPQQRTQFAQQGYLIVRRLISRTELLELDRMVNVLLDGELKPVIPYAGWLPDDFYTFWEPQAQGRVELARRQRVRLMSNMFHHPPYFRAFGGHPAICDVIGSLFQDGVQMFSDTVFMKPAHHGIEAALHQDTAFWPKLEPNAINFWLAVDAATVENGCLHLIPETHAHDLRHHDHPTQGHLLHDHEVDLSRQIACECASGDAIFFDSGLVHRSYPNRSGHSRRAYAAVYGAQHLRHVEPWKTSAIAEKTPNYRFELIRSSADRS